MGFPLLCLSLHRTRKHSCHHLHLKYKVDNDRRIHKVNESAVTVMS